MQVADSIYDYTKPWWNNANDRVMYERSFQQGTREQQLEAIALICADATTRNREIRQELSAPMRTPIYGAMNMSPTIDDIVSLRKNDPCSQSGHLRDVQPTDFSGTPAGQEASSFPSIPFYS